MGTAKAFLGLFSLARACIGVLAVPSIACQAVAYDQDTADRRARPVLARAFTCIACRFCALECPADAITMKLPSRMTEQQKLAIDEHPPS